MSVTFHDAPYDNESSNLNAGGLDNVENKMDTSDFCFSSCNATAGTSPNEMCDKKRKSLWFEKIYSFDDAMTDADVSFYRTEKEKRMNEHKIRIKYMPPMTDEDTTLLILTLINCKLNISLNFSHICLCERVKGWEGIIEPKDIVVTFSNKEIRDVVYSNRRYIEEVEDGMIMICDELGPERAEIWRRAVRIFGDKRVYTNCGGVIIIAWNNKHYRILTLYQFQKFLKKEYSQKCNSGFLCLPNKTTDTMKLSGVVTQSRKNLQYIKYQRK